MIAEAEVLLKELQKLSASQLKALLSVSDALAKLNHSRYQDENPEEKEALFVFAGDAYRSMSARDFSSKDVAFAQQHLRILCGLYGILKPLDLIRPYRLEMSTKLATADCKDLYAFWRAKITASLARELADCPVEERYIVNVASQEYFKAIDQKQLGFPIYTMAFPGPSLHAKSARGAMTRFIIQNEVTSPGGLKDFTGNDGEWAFNPKRSTEFLFVFERNASKAMNCKGAEDASKAGKKAGNKMPAAKPSNAALQAQADVQKIRKSEMQPGSKKRRKK